MNSVPPVSVCPYSLLRPGSLIVPGWARELDFCPGEVGRERGLQPQAH